MAPSVDDALSQRIQRGFMLDPMVHASYVLVPINLFLDRIPDRAAINTGRVGASMGWRMVGQIHQWV